MKNRSALCMVFLITLSLLINSCSVNSIAGGGSDLPNARVAMVSGKVISPDSLPADSAMVFLRKIAITASGDSVMYEAQAFTDSTGYYGFDTVDTGKYVLFVEYNRKNMSALDQNIQIPDTSGIELPSLTVHPTADLIGYIILPSGAEYSGLSVFIPGIERRVPVDNRGMYTLPQCPRGHYDIAFVYNRIGNFSRISAGTDSLKTIYLRNIEFAMMDVMSEGQYAGNPVYLDNAYYVSPKTYAPAEVPTWYQTVDLNSVKYYNHDRDGGFHPWADTIQVEQYDIVISGILTRQYGGVVLITPNHEIFKLTGQKVEWVDSMTYNAMAAVLIRMNNGQMYYEVVDLRLF